MNKLDGKRKAPAEGFLQLRKGGQEVSLLWNVRDSLHDGQLTLIYFIIARLR